MPNPIKFKNKQELENYLKTNGSAGGKIDYGDGKVEDYVGTETKPKTNMRDEGWFGSFIRGVTDPFVNTGAKVLEGVDAAANNKFSDFLSGANEYKPKYISEDKYKKFKENPFLDTAKDVAGVASVAIPGGAFGKGVLGAVKAGVASGALSEFSNQDGFDFNKILQGGATGGAVGGALGLGAKALSGIGNKAKNVGQTLENAGLDVQAKNIGAKFTNDLPLGDQQNSFRSAVKQVKQAGKPISPQGAQSLASQNTDSFRQTLEGAPDIKLSSTVDDISNNLYKKFNLGPDEIAASPTLKGKLSTVVQRIEETKGNPKQLFETVNKLTNDNNLFQDVTLADRNKIIEGARQYARDKLRDTVPNADQYFANNAALNQSTNNAANVLNQADKIPVPLLSGGIEVPGAGAIKRAGTNAIGEGMIKAGQGLQGIQNLFGQVKLPRQITGMATPNNASKFGSILAGSYQGPSQDIQPQDYTSLSIDNTGDNTDNTDTQKLYNDIATELILAGVDPEKAYEQAPLYGQSLFGVQAQDVSGFGKQKSAVEIKTTEKQKAYGDAGSAAQEALNLLGSGKASTGKLASIGNKLGEFFDTQSGGQTDYNSSLAYARTTLQNALLGAAISEGEFKSLSDAIPQVTDEPGVAKQKLQTFIRLTQRRANSK